MKKLFLLTMLFAICLMLGPVEAKADSRFPSDNPDLQVLIDNAPEGGKIIVEPGVYNMGTHHIRITKNLTLESQSGAELTVLEFPPSHDFGILVTSGNKITSTIRGLTIRNGFITSNYGASPTIENNIFKSSNAVCTQPSRTPPITIPEPIIQYNIFTGSYPPFNGVFIAEGCRAIFRHNTIAKADFGNPEVYLIRVRTDNDKEIPLIYNNIMWGNSSINPIYLHGDATKASIAYNIIEGGYAKGINNIDLDPMFVNMSAGDFRLKEGSPAHQMALFSKIEVDDYDSPKEVGAKQGIVGPRRSCRNCQLQ